MQASEVEIRALRRALDYARADTEKNGPAPTRRIPRSEARQFTERDPITLAVEDGREWWNELYPVDAPLSQEERNKIQRRVLAAVGRVMVGEMAHRATVPEDCDPYRAQVDGPGFTVCRICQVIEA